MIVIIDKVKYRVKWTHNSGNIKDSVWPDKSTVCNVNILENSIKACGWGIAKCSKKDNFNKSKGRIVSLTKAISHLPKDVRTLFWNQYKKEINF